MLLRSRQFFYSFARRRTLPRVVLPSPLEIELVPNARRIVKAVENGHRPKKAPPGIDFRPFYMRGRSAALVATAPPLFTDPAPSPFGNSEPESRALLDVNPRVANAFDHLAAEVNYFLDYPPLLIENGIQGFVVLDLYFDAHGEIDEERSRCIGDHPALRGLLVHAGRLGLARWYRSDGSRLRAADFRNQHFHGEFSITYGGESFSKVERSGDAVYRLEHHVATGCAHPAGVDIACVAARAYGIAKNTVSRENRVAWVSLQDRLSQYDELGLRGMRDKIRAL